MGRRASRRHASFSELTENFERLNVATETEDADAARRAASARRPSLSNAIVNPFAAEGEPAKASSPKADSDVSMEDVSVKVLNAPSLPSAPVYRGSTYEDRRVFMKQYERYTTALTAFQNPANQPFCMPVSACIEGDTRQRIALFEFGCSPHEITEEQWVNYFLQAQVSTFRNYVAIDAEMKTLKMDVSLREAPSRMSRLTRDLYVKLEAHNVLQEMFTEAPRRIVGYLLEALEPEGFREIVRHQLTLETHKAKKKQIVPFCKWVSGMLEQYMQWNDIARQQKLTPNVKTDDKAKKSAKPPKPAGAGSTGTASTGPAVAPRLETKRPALPCLKCNSPEHSVRHCPRAQPGEAAALVAEARARRQATNLSTKRVQSSARNVPTPPSASGIERGTVPANIDGLDVNATLLDSGSDESLVARAVIKALEDRGVEIEVCKPAMPARLIPVGKQAVMAPRCVRFKRISFVTSAGPLILRNHCCWVDETDDDLSLNIGRPTMEQLGYLVDGLLVAALAKQSEYISDTKLPDTPESPLLRMQRLQHVACYEPIAEPPTTPLDEYVATPTFEPEDQAFERVQQYFVEGLRDAVAKGLSERGLKRMKTSLDKYSDNFRVQFGLDPPVKVKPLKVRLKKGAKPVKCKAPRYPPLHQIFLETHVQELLKAMLVRENHRSRWASPSRVVPKKLLEDLRMVIDSRRVNSETEPMPFPMPQLEVSITHVIGATVFFSCDWFKGYWQLPLDPESQEYFTFMTHRGMYTPTRVPMGSSDAVAFCQHVVEEIFGDLIHNGVLAWLDDLLGYAATEDALCDLFDQVMERCAQYGLKLHPAKCVFFTRSIKWCGRIISADGVTHCPDRIQGLVDLAPPVTGADLQQLLCAANWMRTSIPEFARITGPLYSSLEAAMHKAGSRKKRALRKVLLEECQWGLPEETSLAVLKDALIRITPLTHPKPDWDVCLYTDASSEFWGAVASQLPPGDVEKPIDQQRHEPLAFLSGKFAGAACRWSIVEKEAFAVVESCQRLNYLLLRPGGFKLFTDHRNLLFIFNPYAVDAGIHRYQADKLQRWALGLSRYDYVIEHVAGEDNVWSDLLSRWGARTDESSRSIRVRRLAVVDHVAPLQTAAFEWPTLAEVRRIQDESLNAELRRIQDESLNAERQPSLVLDQERGIYEAANHAIWIPDDAVDLQQRICVIAHAGASGHRGAKATRAVVEEVFTWSTVRHDVSAFVAGCIHCLSSGASRIPRPFGPTLQATAPNEVLHFDFLSLPRSANGASYLLVLKDGMSGYVELVLCLEATADVTRDALLDWFKRFGVVHHWVSDQGSHFKNSIIAHLTKLFGAQHHFVTAYCPWANGSVEVVNRLVLRAIKTILSEFKLPISSWPSILPLVQHSLNCMPSDRIGGVAPLTAFTGLPSTSQLRAVVGTASVHSLDEATLQRHQQQTLVATRQALDTIHQAAVSTSDKRNAQNRQCRAQQQHVTLPRFEIGDFVLAAGVLPRRNKLALNWSGPKRVVASLNDFTFEVQDLMAPFHITVHHASRLQFYRDSQRGITQDLLDHAHYAAGGHLVDKLLEVRRGPDDYEIKVQWIGLDPLEASWEPATVILEDVPKLVRAFVAAHSRQKVFKDMWDALGDGPLPTNKTTGKSPVANSKTRGGK